MIYGEYSLFLISRYVLGTTVGSQLIVCFWCRVWILVWIVLYHTAFDFSKSLVRAKHKREGNLCAQENGLGSQCCHSRFPWIPSWQAPLSYFHRILVNGLPFEVTNAFPKSQKSSLQHSMTWIWESFLVFFFALMRKYPCLFC